MLPYFRRCIPFFKVPRFRFFVLVLRAACRDKNHMEHCWNDNDKEKPRYWEKIMSHSYLVHHESHMYWRQIEHRPPRLQAGDWSPGPWQRSLRLISTCNEFINNYFAQFWNHMQLGDKNNKFILHRELIVFLYMYRASCVWFLFQPTMHNIYFLF
jgi:hypothetical protein